MRIAPEVKAKNLLDQHSILVHCNMTKKEMKQFLLNTVSGIIFFYKNYKDTPNIKYWQQVKKEIEKL